MIKTIILGIMALAINASAVDILQLKSFEVGTWSGTSTTTYTDGYTMKVKFQEHREVSKTTNELIITGGSEDAKNKKGSYKWNINLKDKTYVYSNSGNITDHGTIDILGEQDYKMTSNKNKCYFMVKVDVKNDNEFNKQTKLYSVNDDYICTSKLTLTRVK